jgi:hypothetical protein
MAGYVGHNVFFSLSYGRMARSRVARFFLVQNTKTGANIPNYNKINQMAIKYFQRPQNRPNFWFENKPSGNPGHGLSLIRFSEIRLYFLTTGACIIIIEI